HLNKYRVLNQYNHFPPPGIERSDAPHSAYFAPDLPLLFRDRPAIGGAAGSRAPATALQHSAGRSGHQRPIRGHGVEPPPGGPHGGHGRRASDGAFRTFGVRRFGTLPVLFRIP